MKTRSQFTLPMRSRGFALVLGGGGARGLAHIGILDVLESEGFFPSLVVGTSMGAIVGAMYAQAPSARLVEQKMKDLLHSEEFRSVGLAALSSGGDKNGRASVTALYGKMKRGYGILRSAWTTGLLEDSILLKSLYRLLEDRRIQDCIIPFAAVSCDLMSGKEVVLKNGSILKAVAASSAIPGVVTPVAVNGRLLVDGGPTSLVPVDACRALTGLPIVAVSVARRLRETLPPKNALDVVLRSRVISETRLGDLALERADVVVRPHVESYSWADFEPLDELIARGRKAAKESLGEIARMVRNGKQTIAQASKRPRPPFAPRPASPPSGRGQSKVRTQARRRR
jgi:NTE family protein